MPVALFIGATWVAGKLLRSAGTDAPATGVESPSPAPSSSATSPGPKPPPQGKPPNALQVAQEIGHEVGGAVVSAAGGSDSVQSEVLADTTAAITGGLATGALSVGTAGLGLAASAEFSAVVSAFANVNRKAENDAKRAQRIASIGAEQTWQLDLKTAIAGIKAGVTATELIGYDDVDPKYSRRGATYPIATTTYSDHELTIIDPFHPVNGIASWVNVYADGHTQVFSLTAEQAAQVKKNAEAKARAQDTGAAIAGYGTGSGALIQEVAALNGTTEGQLPTEQQVIHETGVAQTGSKSDRLGALRRRAR